MAPLKPSAQTQILLGKMDEQAATDAEQRDAVMASMDLFFTKVGSIDQNQTKMEGNFDISAGVIE